jgi:hypothetical protein
MKLSNLSDTAGFVSKPLSSFYHKGPMDDINS